MQQKEASHRFCNLNSDNSKIYSLELFQHVAGASMMDVTMSFKAIQLHSGSSKKLSLVVHVNSLRSPGN